MVYASESVGIAVIYFSLVCCCWCIVCICFSVLTNLESFVEHVLFLDKLHLCALYLDEL